jgi:hypothetical protein
MVTRRDAVCVLSGLKVLCLDVDEEQRVSNACFMTFQGMGLRDSLRKFGTSVLRCRPIPEHIAIIMDGNRRFARKVHVELRQGHSLGFEKLKEVESSLFCLSHARRRWNGVWIWVSKWLPYMPSALRISSGPRQRSML